MTRRGLLEAALAGVPLGAGALGVAAGSARAQVAQDVVELPIAARVAGKGSSRVVSSAFLAIHLAEANRVFAPYGVRFYVTGDADLDPRFRALETKADRDALGDELTAGAINVFYVHSLRDVDDPSLLRMGVCWRRLSNLKQKYVIVAESARDATTAHELGHYLGLPHAYVVNNLMSYLRADESAVFLDAAQGKIVRGNAAGLVKRGEVAR